MNRKTKILVTALFVSASAWSLAATGDGAWLRKVPAADRARQNPLPHDESTPKAGQLLYMQHCASCHGNDAGGRGKRPSLRTGRVREATDGELQWLLKNGSLRNGMPSWSSLPEVQRWQLVRYLHSLSVSSAPE